MDSCQSVESIDIVRILLQQLVTLSFRFVQFPGLDQIKDTIR